MEWAIDDDERLWLLQSRPVTTPVRGVPSGPLLARRPPVAETTLDEDLWAEPLRDALRSALRVTGTASARRLRDSPVVVSLEGGVAVDPPSASASTLDPGSVACEPRGGWAGCGRLCPTSPTR